MKPNLKILARFMHPKTNCINAIIEVKTSDFGKNRRALPMSQADDDKELSKAVVDLGLDLPRNKEARSTALDKLRDDITVSPTIEVVESTGWHRKSDFILTDRTFGPNRKTCIHLNQTKGKVVSPKIDETSLASWKKEINAVTSRSTLAIYTLTIPFTGPLLGLSPTDAEVDVSNLMGPSSTGKSFLLKIATTIYGNDNDDGALIDFDFTPTALEEALQDSNHLFLAIDEEGLSQTEIEQGRRKLALRLTSNSTKSRAKRYAGVRRHIFMVPVAASSNSSTAQVRAMRSDRPLTVRWFDIPVHGPEEGGIFGPAILGELEPKEISGFVKDVLGEAMLYQRMAGLKYLKLLSNKAVRKPYLFEQKAASARFMNRHGTGLAGQQIRILEKFALKFGTASALPALGLVPWTREEGEAAIEEIFQRYVELNPEGFRVDLDVLETLYHMVKNNDYFSSLKKIDNLETHDGIGVRMLRDDQKIACIRRGPRARSAVKKMMKITFAELEVILERHGLLIRDNRGKASIGLRVKRGSGSSDRKIRFMPIDFEELTRLVGDRVMSRA